ncbi:LysR family transcriptional regulator [Burkholderiaceae bacterium DAT-1]|nr:LysR family transcriptional regulator [Burkholderiaceae bacterium DAT-1]
MEIYQLRTFVTVAQQGHLTQAAEILHLSQPAVTAQIKALEEETGVALFSRTPSGVTLTEAGQMLLGDAERIIEVSRDMLNHARSLKGQLSGKLRVGTILTPEVLRMGQWLRALKSDYPLLQIATSQGVSGAVLNAVRKHEVDAGFFIGRNPYQNVHTTPLSEERLIVVGPKEWAQRLDGCDWRELGRQPWVGASQFSMLSKVHAEIWREHNITPKKVFDIDQEQAMLACVEAGLGLCALREDLVRPSIEAGRTFAWGDSGASVWLSFIYQADSEGDLLVMALKRTLQRVWGLSDQADV